MDNRVSIVPKGEAASTDEGFGKGGFGLPPDLLAKARGRVGRVTLILGSIYVAAALITLVVFPDLEIDPLTHWIVHLGQGLAIAVSLALYLVTRSQRLSHTTVLYLGLLYEIASCFAASVGDAWFGYRMDGHIPYITFTSLLIVAYPLIVPSPPRLTVVVALLAAATAPVGVLLLRVLGQVPPEAVDYLRASFMPVVSATIAVFGSAVIYEANAEVAKARELGSYQLQSLLGRGGMGEVWSAKHRLLARPAAIKLVRPELVAGDPESQELLLKRFEREAQTTASMRSPHTIELYDFGIAGDGTFYYVMELLRGFDVDKLVDRWGPMLPERAIHLIRQVCESLGEAHEQGLIHRDVKPANLYVCRYGRELDFVKVLDFGLVKPRGERGDDDPKLTGDNIVGGTPGFIAPEQVLGDRPVDGRTDIYSLGCVSYWMLTGTMVFRGKTPMETMVHHVKTEPVPPSQRTEVEIPRSLENVILACLEKEPEHRPANADALSDLLAACGDEVPPWTRERARQWWEAHGPDSL